MEIVSQFSRYVIVGAFNTGLHFTLINAMSIFFGVYSGTPIILINSISSAVVITHSYFWNRYWSFRSRTPEMASEFGKFILVNLGAFILNVGITYVLTTHVRPPFGLSPLLWENAANAVAIGCIVIWNFIGFKFFVFQGR